MHKFAILSYMKSLSLSKPHMLIMVGVPGSGKTFFAEKFAETFRAPYVSSEKIAAIANGDSKSTEALSQYQIEELMKTQQSIIVESASDTRAERSELTRKARSNGYEALLVWVQTDPVTAKSRFIKDSKAISGNKPSTDDFSRLTKRFTAPNSSEKYIVVSGKHTYASQAKVVLKKLSGPRAEISAHTIAPVRMQEPGRRNITIR
jgi:predicted kinase